MCLTRIKKFETNGIGWKVFKKDYDDPLHSLFFDESYKINKKYFSESAMLATTDKDETYHTGFHTFTNKEDAEWYKKHSLPVFHGVSENSCIVKKILYKNVITTGIKSYPYKSLSYQSLYFHTKIQAEWKTKNLKTVVAREMTICA